MPYPFLLVFLAAGAVVLIVKAVAIRRDWVERMYHLASTRGWQVSDVWWSTPRVEGEVFGCRVEVFMPWRVPERHDRQPSFAAQLVRRNRESAWAFTRLKVTFPGSPQLKFEPEAGRLGRLLKRRDLEVGDPAFDDTVRLGGGETVLRASFDASTRWAVRLLVERGGTFDGEVLTLAWQHDRSAYRDAEAIDCALAAVERLRSDAGTTRQRLARIATDDPKPGVRVGALRCLVERHRTAAETPAAVRAGLEDSDPEVRLVAAVHLGDLAVLEALLPPALPMAVRIAAVEALATHEDGLKILRRVITRLDGQARAAAITALKASGGVAVGGLALAETTGGGLALAETTGDGLALAESDDG